MIQSLQKKLVIDELKNNPPPNSIVLSFDEKAKIPIKQYKGSIWTKEKKVKWPAKQKTKGLIELPASINIHTGEIIYWFYDWKNSFIVIECFEDLLQKYPEQDIYVIVDGWSAHTSYAIKVWAYLHPRLKIIYLPTNASWTSLTAAQKIELIAKKMGVIL